MNGTPIFDIKPYLPYADSLPDALSGFAEGPEDYALEVIIPPEQLEAVAPDDRAAITELLRCDPRPSYQHDPERIYYFEYKNYRIGFRVDGKLLETVSITKIR